MTVVKFGKQFSPNPDIAASSWGAFVTAITAVNDSQAYVCQSPVTDTIDFIKIWTGTNAVAGNSDVRIETIDDTTGLPSGTLVTVGGNVTVAFNAATTEFTATFGTPVSVTKGLRIAFVFQQPASSPPSYQLRSSGETLPKEFPYAVRKITGVSTKSNSDLAIAVHTTTNGYVEMNSGHPISAATTPTSSPSFTSASNPNRYGNKFIPNAALRVTGCWIYYTPSTTSDFIVELYDSANNVIASYTHDANDQQAGAGLNFYEFTSSVILQPGATYRIAQRPTTANGLTQDYIPYASAAYLPAASGAGKFTGTTSGNGTTWTDSTTDLRFIGIIWDGIDIQEIINSFAA